MKSAALILLSFLSFCLASKKGNAQTTLPNYLSPIKKELQKEWPNNKTINLVFHGHSVPAGYFKTPTVQTLEAYPMLVLKKVKALYPNAVINVINTSIGGENSKSGSKRFKSTVLNHRPDILFIDYGLNDRRIGLVAAKKAWEKMIKKALKKNIKVILLTPSPDLKVDLLDSENVLEKHTFQIIRLALTYNIGIVNSYQLFKNKLMDGENLADYMSQGNHPNTKGHSLIAEEIVKYFH